MEDPDEILKELRVDWELVVSDDFNPLHIYFRLKKDSVFASSFRDMFYRLESTMEGIIANNFKGFNDSVNEYTSFSTANKDILSSLDAIISLTDTSDGFSVQNRTSKLRKILGGIEEDASNKEVVGFKSQISKNLLKVREMIYEFDASNDIFDRSSLIVASLNILDKAEYIKIKAVEEYRKAVVYKRYLDLVNEINRSLLDYIFKDKQSCLESFRALITTGSLNELEAYLRDNFQNEFREAIEREILSVYHSQESILHAFSVRLVKKAESITRNMKNLVKKINESFDVKVRENFFTGRENPYKFCVDFEFVFGIIKKELEILIERYTEYKHGTYREYDIGFSVDDLDYAAIYGESRSILDYLSEPSADSGLRQDDYTIILAPQIDVAVAMLKNTTDESLKRVISDKINAEYSQKGLERALERIQHLMLDQPLSIDPETCKLKLFNRALEVFNDYDTIEHREALKKVLDEQLYATFVRKFSEIFTCDKFSLFIDKEALRDSDLSTKIQLEAEENIKDWCIRHSIWKKDLMVSSERYRVVISIINTLKEFDGLLVSKRSATLYHTYFYAWRCQLMLDIIYFFDLLFRQGSYKLYIKRTARVPKMVYEIDKCEKYFEGLYAVLKKYITENISCIGVRDVDGLLAFKSHLRILDEILSSVDPDGSFGDIYEMIDHAVEGRSISKTGLSLEKKIRSRTQQ